MDKVNKQELRRLAEAATGGEWVFVDLRTASEPEQTISIRTRQWTICRIRNEVHHRPIDFEDEANGKFISTANPAAILSLLDELEENDGVIAVWRGRLQRAEAELEQYRKDSERMNTAIMFAANALATVTSSDGSGHADLAESALRMAGIPADEREQLVTEWKAKSQWRIDAEMAKEGGANG